MIGALKATRLRMVLFNGLATLLNGSLPYVGNEPRREPNFMEHMHLPKFVSNMQVKTLECRSGRASSSHIGPSNRTAQPAQRLQVDSQACHERALRFEGPM